MLCSSGFCEGDPIIVQPKRRGCPTPSTAPRIRPVWQVHSRPRPDSTQSRRAAPTPIGQSLRVLERAFAPSEQGCAIPNGTDTPPVCCGRPVRHRSDNRGRDVVGIPLSPAARPGRLRRGAGSREGRVPSSAPALTAKGRQPRPKGPVWPLRSPLPAHPRWAPSLCGAAKARS